MIPRRKRTRLCRRLAMFTLGGVSLWANSCFHTKDVHPRPATWANAIRVKALPNLHQVSDDLYRSALPEKEGYEAAREIGIKTIINLRPSNDIKSPVDSSEPDYVNIPVRTGSPTYEQARRFFAVVDDADRTPVLLHCYHGADRTGAFTALYRINRQGWSKDEAIREMTGGDYDFHVVWLSLVDWVREAPKF